MKTTDFKNIVEVLNNIENHDEKVAFDDVTDASCKVTEAFITPLQESGNENWMEMEELIARSEALYEEQGFINGFIYAMQLQAESNMLFKKEVAKAVC